VLSLPYMILAVPDQLKRAMYAGRSEKVGSLMRIHTCVNTTYEDLGLREDNGNQISQITSRSNIVSSDLPKLTSTRESGATTPSTKDWEAAPSLEGSTGYDFVSPFCPSIAAQPTTRPSYEH